MSGRRHTPPATWSAPLPCGETLRRATRLVAALRALDVRCSARVDGSIQISPRGVETLREVLTAAGVAVEGEG